jgi:cytoskeletal protein CcmA (bactofilin family)
MVTSPPRQAVLAGKVTGKIVIEDKLEVSSSAVIDGEIVAKVLAIANGARIEGAVTVTSGKAIVKFDEKRASDPGRRRGLSRVRSHSPASCSWSAR